MKELSSEMREASGSIQRGRDEQTTRKPKGEVDRGQAVRNRASSCTGSRMYAGHSSERKTETVLAEAGRIRGRNGKGCRQGQDKDKKNSRQMYKTSEIATHFGTILRY